MPVRVRLLPLLLLASVTANASDATVARQAFRDQLEREGNAVYEANLPNKPGSTIDFRNTPYFKNLQQQEQQRRANIADMRQRAESADDDARRFKAEREAREEQARYEQAVAASAFARTHYADVLARAQGGDIAAMYRYAWYLSPFDPERTQWLSQAAERGHAGALASLAWAQYDMYVIVSNRTWFFDKDYKLRRWAAAPHFNSARQLWEQAADMGDVSSMVMCAILNWAGSDEKYFEFDRNKKRAKACLGMLKQVGAITLHDIVEPFLKTPFSPHTYSYPGILMRKEASQLHHETTHADTFNYDFNPHGLAGGENGLMPHLDMIRRETYPTLWTVRQAAQRGNAEAAAVLAQWGEEKHVPTDLDPKHGDHNLWILRSALRPSGQVHGIPYRPTAKDPKFMDAYQLYLHMTDAEIAHWKAKAAQ